MSLAPASGQRVPVRTVVGGGRDTHDGHENSPILVFFSDLLGQHVEQIERRFISQALEKTGRKKAKAAELLGMTFRSFRYYMKKYDLG